MTFIYSRVKQKLVNSSVNRSLCSLEGIKSGLHCEQRCHHVLFYELFFLRGFQNLQSDALQSLLVTSGSQSSDTHAYTHNLKLKSMSGVLSCSRYLFLKGLIFSLCSCTTAAASAQSEKRCQKTRRALLRSVEARGASLFMSLQEAEQRTYSRASATSEVHEEEEYVCCSDLSIRLPHFLHLQELISHKQSHAMCSQCSHSDILIAKNIKNTKHSLFFFSFCRCLDFLPFSTWCNCMRHIWGFFFFFNVGHSKQVETKQLAHRRAPISSDLMHRCTAPARARMRTVT